MDTFVTKEVHEEFVKRMEEEDRRQNKRIEIIEEKQTQISELVTSVKVLAANVENIAREINEQGLRLKEIEGKPGKRWEQLVGYILSAVVTAVIAYFLTR
jgi:molecular chaperone GrpE (heat shock protein)